MLVYSMPGGEGHVVVEAVAAGLRPHGVVAGRAHERGPVLHLARYDTVHHVDG